MYESKFRTRLDVFVYYDLFINHLLTIFTDLCRYGREAPWPRSSEASSFCVFWCCLQAQAGILRCHPRQWEALQWRGGGGHVRALFALLMKLGVVEASGQPCSGSRIPFKWVSRRPPLKPTVTLGTHTWASLNSTKVQTHQHPCSLTHTHTHKLERALKQHPGWTKIILLKRSACGLYSAPLGPICSTGMRWPTRHGHFVEADL